MSDKLGARGYSSLREKIGLILSLLCYTLFIAMVSTFLIFMSGIIFIFFLIILPVLLMGFVHKDKTIIIRRIKATGWALGILILLLFPAFWLIPQQIYVRVNRQTELITPNAPVVIEFKSSFLEENPDYDTFSWEEKMKAAKNYTMEKIVWELDYFTYGNMAHVGTPTQVIQRGMDDCQGQAVVMASLIRSLGFEYVWAVETPFHWWVLVRDPSKGLLPSGWEKKIEDYLDNPSYEGEVLTLNRAGLANRTPQEMEEVTLLFNDKETLYPVDIFTGMGITLTSSPYLTEKLAELFYGPGIIILFLAFFLLALPMGAWTSYMLSNKKSTNMKQIKIKRKLLFKKWGILGLLLIGSVSFWVLGSSFLKPYTMIVVIILLGVLTALASEPKFWNSLKI